jgi:transcriptional regulator with XRE-family HTH domain
MPNIHLGERVRRHRILVGWNHTELGAKVGVSQMTIPNWESGKTSPKPDQKTKLFELLGIGAIKAAQGEEVADADGTETGPSAVGSWLTKSRFDRKMSIPELAVLSGVTAAQLYNIESGRTTNTRQSTIQRIESAIGELLPQETKAEIKRRLRSKGLANSSSLIHTSPSTGPAPVEFTFYTTFPTVQYMSVKAGALACGFAIMKRSFGTSGQSFRPQPAFSCLKSSYEKR